MVLSEVVVGVLVPTVTYLKPSQIFMREEYYGWFLLPNGESVRAVIELTQEYINLLLFIVIIEIIIKMPCDSYKELEPFDFCLIYLLFVGLGAPILKRDNIAHLFVQSTILSKWFMSSGTVLVCYCLSK